MKLVINFSGSLLLALALSLFLVNWVTPAYLVLPADPIFSMPLRYLFWIAGGLALAVSLTCLFADHPGRQLFLISWLATLFAIYQFIVYWANGHGVSGYLGGFSRAFGISAQRADGLAISSSVGLSLTSYGSLLWLRRRVKLDKNFRKMSCPACGGHVKFAAVNLGEKIPCPHCQNTVTLRAPEENLRTSCFFCKENIEFPPHALGSKICCPHCKKDITLQPVGVSA